MSGGQHRVDEVTRTESRGLDRKNNPRIAAHRPPKETAGLRNAGVCAKGTKKESNTLDAADLVRDVENRDYHYLSHFEIRGAKRIYQQLSRSSQYMSATFRNYCSFAYSDLAWCRMGMSGSASFQKVKKSL